MCYKVVLNFALCQKFQYFILCSLFLRSEIKTNVGISAIFLRQTLFADLPPSWGHISCSYVRNQFNFYWCFNIIRLLCSKLIFWQWVENFYVGWANMWHVQKVDSTHEGMESADITAPKQATPLENRDCLTDNRDRQNSHHWAARDSLCRQGNCWENSPDYPMVVLKGADYGSSLSP